MEHGGGGGIRRHQITQGCGQQQGAQDGTRNTPVDHSLLQQEQAAQQVTQVNPAPADAAPALEYGVTHHFTRGEPLIQPCLQGIEWRSHGEAIHPLLELRHAVAIQAEAGKDDGRCIAKADVIGANDVWRQPAGHLHGEGDQQQHIGHHGRVEQVLAQAAIEVLGDDDGKGGTQYQHPPGQQGGQREANQHGGQSGTAIHQGGLDGAAAQAKHQRLGPQRRHQRQQDLDEGTPAKEPGLGQQAGQASQDHQQHQGLGLFAVMSKRRTRDIEHGSVALVWRWRR